MNGLFFLGGGMPIALHGGMIPMHMAHVGGRVVHVGHPGVQVTHASPEMVRRLRAAGPGRYMCKHCHTLRERWDPMQRSTLHKSHCPRYYDHTAAQRQAEREAAQERAKAAEEERKRQRELEAARRAQAAAAAAAQEAAAAQAAAAAAAQEAAEAQDLLDELED